MTISQDLGYALRAMGRAPGFTAVLVLSLALGIGGNTIIFSLINILMLRPIPARDPSALVGFLKVYPGDPRINSFSRAEYRHIRDLNNVFSDLIATAVHRSPVRGAGRPSETIDVEAVSPNYFPMLGLKPLIGRLIGPTDGQTG